MPKTKTTTKLEEALRLVRDEVLRATKIHGPINSAHEGYAVLLEEVDELWDAIKGDSPLVLQKAEAVQVAAMAVRFLIDVCLEPEPPWNPPEDHVHRHGPRPEHHPPRENPWPRPELF